MSKHIQPDLRYEIPFWQAGLSLICGIDEAGRGCLAGAVYAAAVILPPEQSVLQTLAGVRDSKQMTASQRVMWESKIKEIATTWGVGNASNLEIDSIGIVPATRLAMQRAVENLTVSPDHLLIDAVILKQVDYPQTALIKGDVYCLSIACASVLAKTARDRVMIEMEVRYPGYGFAQHKGYGTLQHRLALQGLGARPIHRKTFAPVRQCEEESLFPN
jgi:ribonuclease HII